MALRRREWYRSRTVIEQEMRVTGSDGITMVPFYMVEGDIARRIMHNMECNTRWAQDMLEASDNCDEFPHRGQFYRDEALSYMIKIVGSFYFLTGEILESDWESISAYWV